MLLVLLVPLLCWLLAWLGSSSTEGELLRRVEQQGEELRELRELMQQVADRLPREEATELQCQNSQ